MTPLHSTFGIALGGLLLSPSAQLGLDPAFDRSRDHAWVMGLRATMLF